MPGVVAVSGRRPGQLVYDLRRRRRRRPRRQAGQKVGTNGLAARKAVIGHSGAKRGVNRRYQALITRALNSVRGKDYRTSQDVVLSTAAPFHVNGTPAAIPVYQPAGVSPFNLPHSTRTTDRVFIKGFNIRMGLTSLLTRYGGVRILMFHNSSPNEGLDTVTLNNLYESAGFADTAPLHNWARSSIQRFNWDLVLKKSDLLMDRVYKLSTTIAGSETGNVLNNFSQYVPFNRIVRYESDPAGTSTIPKSFVYLVVVAMGETGFSTIGTVDMSYTMDTYFTEDA